MRQRRNRNKDKMAFGGRIHRKARDGADRGLSVAEAIIGLFGTALMLTVTMKVLFTSWVGCNAVTSRLEVDAAWLQMERVVEADLHSSTITTLSNGALSVSTVNGKSYRYLVNSNHELVRVEQGGGAAVVASGIISFHALSESGLVHVFATFADGGSRELTVAPLETFEP